MGLNTIVRKAQYQAARLEVIEQLFETFKIQQPSLQAEIAHNTVSTIRKSLYDACEKCFEASSGNELRQSSAALLTMVLSVSNMLTSWANQTPSPDAYSLFIKEILLNIAADLIALSAKLDTQNPKPLHLPTKFDNPEPELELLP
jgi:hypothetical protein